MSRNPPSEPVADCPADPWDVLVTGAGPAGEAIASACAREGLTVALVDPTPAAAWVPSYAAWVDDLVAAGVGAAVCGAVWPSVRVHLDDVPIEVVRPYGRIDNARLRAALREPRVVVRAAMVRDVVADPSGARVRLGDGETLAARVVVDASGHGGCLLPRTGGARRFQAAVGRLGRLAEDSAPFEGACWMDFRPLTGERADDAPTFLYGMALPDGRTFLEETSLVRGPAVPFDVLEARLDARMARLGLRFARVDEHERCWIPMDPELPDVARSAASGVPVLPFGGAAGMVHPASGFMVGDVLCRAPVVARALAEALRDGRAPAHAVAAAWDVLWPRERVRGRDMHLFGASALAAMGPHEIRAFFRAFFALPLERRDAFLGFGFDAAALASTMLALFLDAPMAVRASLVSRGITRGLYPLTRATLAPISEVLR
jgi:lycopene beta-cyclase